MRVKRKKRDASEAALRRHLRLLGIESNCHYQQWCLLNGLNAELYKSVEDRQNELLLAVTTAPNWQQVAAESGRRNYVYLHGSRDELLEKIFTGNLTRNYRVGSALQPILDAVQELSHVAPEKKNECLANFRRVLSHLEEFGHGPLLSCSATLSARFNRTFLEAVARLATQKQAWIRPLEDWHHGPSDRLSVFRSLLNHLLVRHTCPEFLMRSWFSTDFWHRPLTVRVSLHLSAGHSIRTLGLPIDYNKRMSHHFQRAPSNFDVYQALRWGQIRGFGGSKELAQVIVRSFLGRTIEHWPFWSSVILWIIQHPELPLERVGDVLRYLNNQRFGIGNGIRCFPGRNGVLQREPIPPSQPRLSMQGRTVVSLLRETVRWQSRQVHNQFVWDSTGIRPFYYTDRSGQVWTINELIGNGALLEEGNRLMHCVAAYAFKCAEGASSIWSMKVHQGVAVEHRLTIEVNRNGRSIMQIRGFANRLPSSNEIRIIQRWCAASFLDMPAEFVD